MLEFLRNILAKIDEMREIQSALQSGKDWACRYEEMKLWNTPTPHNPGLSRDITLKKYVSTFTQWKDNQSKDMRPMLSSSKSGMMKGLLEL